MKLQLMQTTKFFALIYLNDFKGNINLYNLSGQYSVVRISIINLYIYPYIKKLKASLLSFYGIISQHVLLNNMNP